MIDDKTLFVHLLVIVFLYFRELYKIDTYVRVASSDEFTQNFNLRSRTSTPRKCASLPINN
jgi:hypothetical protein